MYTPLQVSIPEPCHEDWHKMTPVEFDQRHCQACDRVLTDFAGMTDKQIGSFLRRHEGKLCGRWRADQLDRKLTVGGPRRLGGWRAAATATGLTLALPLLGQEVVVPEKPATTLVRGIVTEDFSSEGLIGVSILLKGSNTGAITDIDGRFEISVPTGQESTLRLSYIGYETLDTIVYPENGDSALEMSLDIIMPTLLMGEMVVVRRSILHRVFVQPVRRYLVNPIRNLLTVDEYKRAARQEARKERRAARTTAPSTSPAPATAPEKNTAAQVANVLQLTASPNPVANHVQVAFQLPAAGKYQLELFSAEGRLIAERRGKGEAGEQNLVLDREVSGLPAGPYVLHLRTENGEQVTTIIVKQ